MIRKAVAAMAVLAMVNELLTSEFIGDDETKESKKSENENACAAKQKVDGIRIIPVDDDDERFFDFRH